MVKLSMRKLNSWKFLLTKIAWCTILKIFWGCFFLSLLIQEVLDADNGYCVNDSIILHARVSADAPHGIKLVACLLASVLWTGWLGNGYTVCCSTPVHVHLSISILEINWSGIFFTRHVNHHTAFNFVAKIFIIMGNLRI